MKKILTLLMFSALLFVSCKEEDNKVEEFINWKETNANFFKQKFQLACDAKEDLDTIRCFAYTAQSGVSAEKYIVVRKLETGDDTSASPLYSDSVKLHYRGYMLKSTTYNVVPYADYGITDQLGYKFDESYTGKFNWQTAYAASFKCGDMITGFTTALQKMHKGDRWLVYIPQQLAYGGSISGSIPAYSTLVFDIALEKVYK